MRIVIGAPGNGTVLKDEVLRRLQDDPRVEEILDLSAPGITYPAVSIAAARHIAAGRAERGLLFCGTGIGTAIAAGMVPGVRAATAHDLVTVRGSVQNYDAQILCMGQNVIAPAAAGELVDLWLDLRHDPQGPYGALLAELLDSEPAARSAEAAEPPGIALS